MCVQINAEDFRVVHHELGHDYYGLLYAKQPFLYRDGAIDAFHEAVGDTIALSTTPGYLKQIGLIDRVPSEKGDLEYLLNTALDKVAFLPFGAVIDQWRWKVFSGEIPPADYNKAWWDLRNKYQGVDRAGAAHRSGFRSWREISRPGEHAVHAIFPRTHPPVSVSSRAVQGSGLHGPLHRCSIYGNKAAGAKLAKMLEMGSSRPWPEALAALSGESADGRHGDSRLLRAAQNVARRAEPHGQAGLESRNEAAAGRRCWFSDRGCRFQFRFRFRVRFQVRSGPSSRAPTLFIRSRSAQSEEGIPIGNGRMGTLSGRGRPR